MEVASGSLIVGKFSYSIHRFTRLVFNRQGKQEKCLSLFALQTYKNIFYFLILYSKSYCLCLSNISNKHFYLELKNRT